MELKTPIRPVLTIPPAAVLFVVGAGTLLLLHPHVPEMGRLVFGILRPGANRLLESAAHVIVFLTMTSLLLLGTRPGRLRRWSVIGAAVGYAFATEYAQSWAPGRSVDLRDALCNVIGVCAAVGIIEWPGPRKKKTAAISAVRHRSGT